MRYYLDSSVALHAVLPGGAPTASAWLDATISAGDAVYSSTLLQLELVRVLRREGLPIARARPVTDRVAQVSIDDGVLTAAAAIEPHVKSLDAIHLATCALIGPDTRLVTHDGAMRQAASVLGFPTFDPVEPIALPPSAG